MKRVIHEQILAAFKRHGIGNPLTLTCLREMLGEDGCDQSDLPRRIRELRDLGYGIRYDPSRKGYVLESSKPSNRKSNVDPIPSKLAAEIRLAAHGRCQMCGKTIKDDEIRLVIDHRVPRTWGGPSERHNLWAVCEQCNIAKRDFFAAFDDSLMTKVMGYDEPIVRIGELLKAYGGKMVPRRLIEVVAEGADSWPRRLRELRELGWKVEHVHDSDEKGCYSHAYRLVKSKPWPEDVPGALREYRRNVKKKRGTSR